MKSSTEFPSLFIITYYHLKEIINRRDMNWHGEHNTFRLDKYLFGNFMNKINLFIIS
jgi:hypothetical protein